MDETVLDIVRDKVGEEQRVDTLVLVLRFHGYEEQIHIVRLAAQGLKQVPPAGGEQTSAGFLQRAGE